MSRLSVDKFGNKVISTEGELYLEEAPPASAEPSWMLGGPAPAKPAPSPAVKEVMTSGVRGIGPSWTRGLMEAPAGEKNMGSWTAACYTEEQQERLNCDEHGALKVERVPVRGIHSAWSGVKSHFINTPHGAYGYGHRMQHGNLGGHAAKMASIRHQSVAKQDQLEVSGLVESNRLNGATYAPGGVAHTQQMYGGGVYGAAYGGLPGAAYGYGGAYNGGLHRVQSPK